MIQQYGVVPFRDIADGTTEILLITSRETRRWVVPRGNPIAGLTPPGSAAQEAFEEAGIKGDVAPEALGTYRYDKRRASGLIDEILVALFPMRVREILDDWPERAERERRWFAAEAAAASVAEAELAALIRRVGDGSPSA
ncbi:MAG: phosphate transport regulator [Alphaproteobacteria bacterium]|nr:phosphate transport regulator [Alphaproteobacteria bacterium]